MSEHFEEMYKAFYIKEHTSLSGRADIMNYVPTRDEYRFFDTPPYGKGYRFIEEAERLLPILKQALLNPVRII